VPKPKQKAQKSLRVALASELHLIGPLSVLLPDSALAAIGALSGSVYRDVKWNGIKDAGESPVSGVRVYAYGAAAGADGALNTADAIDTQYSPAASREMYRTPTGLSRET
jgi:hypothetical protein